MDCIARRRGLQRRERRILCMNVGVTTASGSASSMHRGSWSRDDDGSDVHNAAGWIESWRPRVVWDRAPGVARFWRGSLILGSVWCSQELVIGESGSWGERRSLFSAGGW